MTLHMPKNSYTKKTNKLVISFGILRHNLSKFVTQTGLYCSKQLEATFNEVGKKSLHIIFNRFRWGRNTSAVFNGGVA